ncbi:hypothetical protein QBC32DRAFT_267364 [Pseudoneurospora amorphoporcata]|uniref:Uncharacterized protein n=1 Tax=Pseudoneurospora amorphoporcata TaxID=241081 RepID=A0AAN6NQK2_9PEZI|nr:hypothetical protein QBC32DRAFT_267364 [Pseudoneurospora amorphoporcata]
MNPRVPTELSPSPPPPHSSLLTSSLDLDLTTNIMSHQVDETNAAVTTNPAPLAGTRRRRADNNDKDEVARPIMRRRLNNGYYNDHEAYLQKPPITHQAEKTLTCQNEDLAGRILWLGNEGLKKMEPRDSLTAPHPVVIMSPRVKANGTVDFLVCTSFNGLNLAERFPEDSDRRPELAKQVRSYFLPIEGCTERHPDDPIRNFMVQTTKRPAHSKKRSSYVNTMVLRTTQFDCLEAYRDGNIQDGGSYSQDYSIDELSYQRLDLFRKNQDPPPENILRWGTMFKVKKAKTNKTKGNKKTS